MTALRVAQSSRTGGRCSAEPSLASSSTVVDVASPQALRDDPKKRLHTRWETRKFVDGYPKVQPIALRVEGGTSEPQAVIRLIFIVADPTWSFF